MGHAASAPRQQPDTHAFVLHRCPSIRIVGTVESTNTLGKMLLVMKRPGDPAPARVSHQHPHSPTIPAARAHDCGRHHQSIARCLSVELRPSQSPSAHGVITAGMRGETWPDVRPSCGKQNCGWGSLDTLSVPSGRKQERRLPTQLCSWLRSHAHPRAPGSSTELDAAGA